MALYDITVGMKTPSYHISVVLPDIRSAYNIGSIFRTSDAVGIHSVYLTGYSPCPVDQFNRSRKDIAKTALGAEKTIPWKYEKDIKMLINKIKKEGFCVVALEQSKKAVDYRDVKKEVVKFFKNEEMIKNKSKIKKTEKVLKNTEENFYKVAFVLGREVEGVSGDVLKKADIIAEIPMVGKKESLNVSVSAGIMLFEFVFG